MPRIAISRTQNIGASANLFLRSDALANAAWTKTELTVADSSVDVTAPDGTAVGVTKVTETTANSNHVLLPAASPGTVKAGQTLQVAFSVSAVLGTLSTLRRFIIFFNDGTALNRLIFNPRTGIIDETSSSGGATTSGVMFTHPQNASWYRCCAFYKQVIAGQESNAAKVILETDNGANGAAISNSFAGSIDAGLYLAELTCYLGNHPLTYVRTDGAPITGATPRGLMAYEG